MLLIGHVDFYLNGGQEQPNCTWGFMGSSCSHSKAHEFLIDVYKNEKKCQSTLYYDHQNKSKIKTSETSPEFGELFGTINSFGSYFITEDDCN